MDWEASTWELLCLAIQAQVQYASRILASADVTHNIMYRSALPALSLPPHQMTAAEETVASVPLVDWTRAAVVLVFLTYLLSISPH